MTEIAAVIATVAVYWMHMDMLGRAVRGHDRLMAHGPRGRRGVYNVLTALLIVFWCALSAALLAVVWSVAL